MTTIQVKTNRASYTYEGYPIADTTWNSASGNYIFMKKIDTGWRPLYVGIATNLKERFASHEKLPLAKKQGATYIFAHVNNNEAARSAEEADIISHYQPPLNDLLK